MFLDRDLYTHIVGFAVKALAKSDSEQEPFPHVLIRNIFPQDVYQQALALWPGADVFHKASARHHSDEYGGSTRQRMKLVESSLKLLPAPQRTFWTTLRAATSSSTLRTALFEKLTPGLCRRFAVSADEANKLVAFPRSVIYSEVEGYRIAPHPDTREKVVTMQFAFPADDSLKEVGTEFYSRSANPLHYLREPKGFVIEKTMPFLPNHAYAFTVLNTMRLKSWHGRCKLATLPGVRNSLLQIWYAKADETHHELDEYERELTSPPLRKAA